jgi:thiamine kinase-like enzyme
VIVLGEGTTEEEHQAEAAIRATALWQGAGLRYRRVAPAVASPMYRAVEGHCWVIEADRRDRFFLKIAAAEASPFIDSAATAEAATLATGLGIAPALLAADPAQGTLVFALLDEGWRTAQLRDLMDPAVLARIVEAQAKLHAGPPLARTESIFERVEDHAARAAAAGVSLPPDHGWMLECVREIAAAVAAVPVTPVPCHGDLIASNIMLGADGQVMLVDWDQAANADPCWDLGVLLAEGVPFDRAARVLLGAVYSGSKESVLARCRLYGIADDVMWGIRGLLLAATTRRVDVEFFKYAQWRFLRARLALRDPRFEERLRLL